MHRYRSDSEARVERFEEELKYRLGIYWLRALTVFLEADERWRYGVFDALSHAADRGVVDKVLEILEHHRELLRTSDGGTIQVFGERSDVFLRFNGRRVGGLETSSV